MATEYDYNPAGFTNTGRRSGNSIFDAEKEEKRLRKAAMQRMAQRSAKIKQEGVDLEKGLSAAAGRGAAAAAGRRSGMAGGGGKMAALAGIESDMPVPGPSTSPEPANSDALSITLSKIPSSFGSASRTLNK